MELVVGAFVGAFLVGDVVGAWVGDLTARHSYLHLLCLRVELDLCYLKFSGSTNVEKDLEMSLEL